MHSSMFFSDINLNTCFSPAEDVELLTDKSSYGSWVRGQNIYKQFNVLEYFL